MATSNGSPSRLSHMKTHNLCLRAVCAQEHVKQENLNEISWLHNHDISCVSFLGRHWLLKGNCKEGWGSRKPWVARLSRDSKRKEKGTDYRESINFSVTRFFLSKPQVPVSIDSCRCQLLPKLPLGLVATCQAWYLQVGDLAKTWGVMFLDAHVHTW